jgi:integrase
MHVAAQLIHKHAGQGSHSAGSITAADWVNYHISHAASQHWEKPRSLRDCTGPRLRAFAKKFAARPLSGLAGSDLLAWLQSLFVSASTKRGYYRVIHSSLNRAVRLGYLASNPLSKDQLSSLPKPAKPMIEVMTDEEEAKLFSAVKGRVLEPAMMLGRYAGLRIEEIIMSDWENIDWSRRVIAIRAEGGWSPKSHSEREVPLSKPLEKFLRARRRKFGPVFPNTKGRRYKDSPDELLWKACDAAGIRRIGWHILRHTFATKLLLKGATLYQVSRLLGHSSVRVTEAAYAHVAAKDLASVVNLL